MTYPLVKDVKLIVTIAENLHQALVTAMDAILYYDRLYKRISQLPENFNSRFDIFKRSCVPRYNIERDHLVIINDLRQLVICNNKYRKMKVITIEKMKGYLVQSKSFMEKINNVLKHIK
jgi:hypothetical protein